jgi:GWxTD domain-containing protein
MKNNKSYIKKLILIFAAPVFIACYTSPPASGDAYKYDFSSLYNPSKSSLQPDCMVYHNKEETSLLFFKQNTSELYFDNAKTEEKTAKLLLKYVLRVQETNEMADSLSTSYTIDVTQNGKDIVSYIEIKAETGKKYDLVVLFADANTKSYRRLLLEVDKTDKSGYQNFFIEKLGEINQPVFYRVIQPKEIYKISYNRINTPNLYVEYYNNFNKIADPPHIIQENSIIHTPDTSYYINDIDSVCFDSTGVYLIKFSKNHKNGIALVNSGLYFPNIKTPEQMIGPMGYLTSERQIDKIKNAANIKNAIDEFWISRTDDANRAKELIRIFYNRVQLANKFFTSHLEGWQTDRGMVYIILGPPSTIYKNPDSEEWFYGENVSASPLSFMFQRRDNIFSHNDYYLLRDTKYQTMWAQAVETWRKGRAFSMSIK